MAPEKKIRELLNRIGFALADENIGNRVARLEGALAHQELLGIFEGEDFEPGEAFELGGYQKAGGSALASERIGRPYLCGTTVRLGRSIDGGALRALPKVSGGHNRRYVSPIPQGLCALESVWRQRAAQ